MVSLRERELWLMALRGCLSVDGRDVDMLALRPHLHFELTEGLTVEVERVEIPTHSLLLCGAEQSPIELGATPLSLLPPLRDAAPRRLRVVMGYVPDAVGHIWHSGATLWIRPGNQAPEPVTPGGRWDIEGCALWVSQAPIGSIQETVREARSKGTTIVARYATVHVLSGEMTSVLTGRPAVLVSELVRFQGKPIHWEMLAREIWGQTFDREQLRKNFDSTMTRLRRQLRELKVRENLVALDGSGNVELVLFPGDRWINET